MSGENSYERLLKKHIKAKGNSLVENGAFSVKLRINAGKEQKKI